MLYRTKFLKSTMALFLGLTAAALAQEPPAVAGAILSQADAAQQAAMARNKDAALDHIQLAKGASAQILAAHPDSATIEINRQAVADSPDGQYVASLLNVTSAAQQLDTALVAVQSEDWEAALTALKAVRESVSQSTIKGNEPLQRTQAKLEMARGRLLNAQYQEASQLLREASQGMTDFARMFPGPHADEAEFMRQQMLDYAGKLPEDAAATADRINLMWLDPVMKWQKEGGVKHIEETKK